MSSSTDQRYRLIEIKPGVFFQHSVLSEICTTITNAMFLGKLYDLKAEQLQVLLDLTPKKTSLRDVLSEGGHSTTLQSYYFDTATELGILPGHVDPEQQPLDGELAELWQASRVEIAQSIKDVAKHLESVIGKFPGKQAKMTFGHMMQLNRQRMSIGTYSAQITHPTVDQENLVILDVSGSVSRGTVEALAEEVVGLGYMANASLAIVSNTTTLWGPGEYSVDGVLAQSEYGGTRYETLAPLFKQDWDKVVTIADYDSRPEAKDVVRTYATGRVGEVIDISLVHSMTFLSEVVGTIADKVTPIVINANHGMING